jgi:hypothetical protein
MAATATPTTRSERADRAAFAVIAAFAGILGLTHLATALWYTVALALGAAPVELLARGELPGATDARITTATVTSDALPSDSVTLLVAASAVNTVIVVAVYLAIVGFLVMTARGTPFHRFAFPLTLAAGLAMSVGGVLAAGLDGLGRMMAGNGLGTPPEGPFEVAFALDLGPWAFGFVVLVAAYVLRAGNRLQRDTEGLV